MEGVDVGHLLNVEGEHTLVVDGRKVICGVCSGRQNSILVSAVWNVDYLL